MSAAEDAYRAAERAIAVAKEEGANELSFDFEKFRALEELPAEIADLSGLQVLWLDNTAINDEGLGAIEGLKGLENLSLFRTAVTDAGLRHLTGLTQLQSLTLSKTAITDAGVRFLSRLVGLQGIFLSNTAITDLGLRQLTGLSGLQWISLDGTGITDEGLSTLGGLTTLEVLFLADTAITDAGLSSLAGLTSLRQLFVDNTPITEEGLAGIAGLSELQDLSIDNTGVRDLRPLLAFDRLNIGRLRFHGIPALDRDPRLKELSEIAHEKDCARQTLAYLREVGDGWPPGDRRGTMRDADPPITARVPSDAVRAHLGFLLRTAPASRVAADTLASQIEAAITAWLNETGTNHLPDELAVFEDIARTLRGFSSALPAAPAEDLPDRRALETRLAELEEQVARLADELDAAHARAAAAESKLAGRIIWPKYKERLAEDSATLTAWTVKVGVVSGAVHLLGVNSATVTEFLKVLQKVL
ncbi:leucine-rich repeat domain-containing protein [Rhodovulum strictum]|nr:hypothetical protein [Rhodovulum strictum]